MSTYYTLLLKAWHTNHQLQKGDSQNFDFKSLDSKLPLILTGTWLKIKGEWEEVEELKRKYNFISNLLYANLIGSNFYLKD